MPCRGYPAIYAAVDWTRSKLVGFPWKIENPRSGAVTILYFRSQNLKRIPTRNYYMKFHSVNFRGSNWRLKTLNPANCVYFSPLEPSQHPHWKPWDSEEFSPVEILPERSCEVEPRPVVTNVSFREHRAPILNFPSQMRNTEIANQRTQQISLAWGTKSQTRLTSF